MFINRLMLYCLLPTHLSSLSRTANYRCSLGKCSDYQFCHGIVSLVHVAWGGVGEIGLFARYRHKHDIQRNIANPLLFVRIAFRFQTIYIVINFRYNYSAHNGSPSRGIVRKRPQSSFCSVPAVEFPRVFHSRKQ